MEDFKDTNEKLERILENYEPEIITEDVIWEMANLTPKETGLPVMIYISNKRGQHSPRVKFMTQPGNLKPSLLAEVTVENEPRLICSPKVKQKALKYLGFLIPWVKENKQILLDLYYDKLTEREASNLIADKYLEK